MWNCVEIIYGVLELHKNIKMENILQNLNDQYFNKSYVTNNLCETF